MPNPSSKEESDFKQVRIFISSPSDVREERTALEKVIREDLQQMIGDSNKLFLKPILWEKDGWPSVSDDIQTNLFEQLGEYHIFVGFFWRRFGSPTSTHESGSEAEFEDAYAKWQEDKSRPILMYFSKNEKDNRPEPASREDAMERLDQEWKVKEFRKKIEKEKGTLYWTYNDVEEFKDLTRRHLARVLNEKLKKEKPPVNLPIYPAPFNPDYTSELHELYLKALRREFLRIPLTVLGDGEVDSRAVRLDEVFITLNVHAKDLEHLRGEKPHDPDHVSRSIPALDVIKKHEQVVLLGDPGSGKSSLVKHILANLAETELSNQDPLIPGTEGLLPVMVVLRDLATRLRKASMPLKQSERRSLLAKLIVDQAVRHAKNLEVPEFEAGIRQAFLDEKVFLVLDGLDEVPAADRKLVREAAGAALNHFNLPRQIITCRTRSYSGEAVFGSVPTYALEDLTKEQITSFVENWYQAQNALGRFSAQQIKTRIESLVEVATRDPLLPLAINPMLLTTMTIIHQQHTKLPEERVKLYKLAVDLLIRRWQEENAGLPESLKDFLMSEEKVGPALTHLAFKAHEPGEEAADLEKEEAAELLTSPLYLGSKAKAEMFLDYVDKRSGLLIGKGGSDDEPDTYSFPHRTFQEYLAGCYAVGAPKAVQRLRELASEGEFWSEAVTQGIQEQVMNSGNFGRDKLLTLSSLLTQNDPQNEADERVVLWAGRMAREVGADVVETAPGEY